MIHVVSRLVTCVVKFRGTMSCGRPLLASAMQCARNVPRTEASGSDFKKLQAQHCKLTELLRVDHLVVGVVRMTAQRLRGTHSC